MGASAMPESWECGSRFEAGAYQEVLVGEEPVGGAGACPTPLWGLLLRPQID